VQHKGSCQGMQEGYQGEMLQVRGCSEARADESGGEIARRSKSYRAIVLRDSHGHSGATVIAALREKVNAINELHIEGQRQKNIRIYESEAVDTGPMGLPVNNPHVLAAVDKQARSQLRTLSMYVGMSALLTINADMATEFVNGTLGRVEQIIVDESNEDIVKAIRFGPTAPRTSSRSRDVSCRSPSRGSA